LNTISIEGGIIIQAGLMTRTISIDIEDRYQEGRFMTGTDRYQHKGKNIIAQDTDTITNIHQDIII
jgi:hypothetical protein